MSHQFICNYQNKFIYTNNNNLIILSIHPNKNIDLNNDLEILYHNDKYTKYKGTIPHDIDMTQINDISDNEIKEFCKQDFKFKKETYQDYINNVYPIIKEQKFTWIDNIMNKTAEQDKLLYEDDNFVLMPDLKWSQINLNDFYCLTIVKDKELRSIRDLTSSHLNLLLDMYEKSMNVIKQKYDIDRNKLRCYFHYHPTWFRIHLHINLIKNTVKEPVETVFLLETVINNIKLDSNYYQKIDLIVKDI